MKMDSIRRYLQPQTIMGRKSTFSNAFASALAPHDEFSLEHVAAGILDLGQDPEAVLECVYCGQAAATWDHVFNRVLKGEPSGHGHRIRNLVPCCRTCNERKGKRHWREWIALLSPADIAERIARMECFLGRTESHLLTIEEIRRVAGPELKRFLDIRSEVFELMNEADQIAKKIRYKCQPS